MSLPPRCFTCGSIIGHKWETYVMLLQEGHTDGEALKLLELGSYCCNRMLLSHMPMIDQLLVRKAIEGKSTKRVIEASSGNGTRMDGREDGDDGGGDD